MTISAQGGEIAVKETILDEDTHTRQPPRRLGIDFVQPVTTGSITVRAEPYRSTEDPDNLVRNGSFEAASANAARAVVSSTPSIS